MSAICSCIHSFIHCVCLCVPLCTHLCVCVLGACAKALTCDSPHTHSLAHTLHCRENQQGNGQMQHESQQHEAGGSSHSGQQPYSPCSLQGAGLNILPGKRGLLAGEEEGQPPNSPSRLGRRSRGPIVEELQHYFDPNGSRRQSRRGSVMDETQQHSPSGSRRGSVMGEGHSPNQSRRGSIMGEGMSGSPRQSVRGSVIEESRARMRRGLVESLRSSGELSQHLKGSSTHS